MSQPTMWNYPRKSLLMDKILFNLHWELIRLWLKVLGKRNKQSSRLTAPKVLTVFLGFIKNFLQSQFVIKKWSNQKVIITKLLHKLIILILAINQDLTGVNKIFLDLFMGNQYRQFTNQLQKAEALNSQKIRGPTCAKYYVPHRILYLVVFKKF